MRLRTVFLLALTMAGGLFFLWLYEVSEREKRELMCLAKIVYFESRNQPELGQKLVAHSVMERVRANKREFGGSTICKVMRYEKKRKNGKLVPQYSFRLLPEAQQVPKDAKKWKESLSVAEIVRSGAWKPDEKFIGAKWYMNPDQSEPQNICWFRRNLISVGREKDHEFFRRPWNDLERMILDTLDVPECKQVKSKKKKEASKK